MSQTKQMLLFLDTDDEMAAWADIRARRPEVHLVDGSRWSTADPPLRSDIAGCSETIVYLWSPSVVDRLLSQERGDGYDGPAAGVVVEWSRSLPSDEGLRSGRLAAGWDPSDAAMAAFVRDAFASFRRVTSEVAQRVDGQRERSYRVGTSTATAARAGLRLRDRSVPVFFEMSGSSGSV